MTKPKATTAGASQQGGHQKQKNEQQNQQQQKKKIRVALFTVMGFAIETLVKVIDERDDAEIVVVVTCTGPKSRRSDAHIEVVKALWDTNHPNVDVITSNKRTKYIDIMTTQYNVDLICSVGYPWLLPEDILTDKRIKYGSINFHNSYLPKLRGPNSFGWAIINGDTTLHFCAHRMDETFDTGPILVRKQLSFDINETIGDLFVKLAPMFKEMVTEAIDLVIADGTAAAGTPQTGEPTHAPKFTDEFRWIDFTDSAINIHNKVRAFYGAREIPKGALAKIQNIDTSAETNNNNTTTTTTTICITRTWINLNEKQENDNNNHESQRPEPGTILSRDADKGKFRIQCGDITLEVLEWHKI